MARGRRVGKGFSGGSGTEVQLNPAEGGGKHCDREPKGRLETTTFNLSSRALLGTTSRSNRPGSGLVVH